jgi:hypothetical protein
LFNVESPTPKSDESWGRVKPLVAAIRTAAYFFAILYLLHSKHCSNETGTKPRQDQAKIRVCRSGSELNCGLTIAFTA